MENWKDSYQGIARQKSCLCKGCTGWEIIMRRGQMKHHLIYSASPVVRAVCYDVTYGYATEKENG